MVPYFLHSATVLFIMYQFSFILTFLYLSISARGLFTDIIDFSSFPEFSALRTCGNCCLCAGTNCTSSQCISTSVGCTTNTCLCSSSSHSLALGYLDTCVRTACPDQTDTAVQSYNQVFGAYCQSISKSTSTSTTAASTPTGRLMANIL
jgi:hypothetical protein